MDENKQFIARLAFDVLAHLENRGCIYLDTRFVNYSEEKNQENTKIFLRYYSEIYGALSEKLK